MPVFFSLFIYSGLDLFWILFARRQGQLYLAPIAGYFLQLFDFPCSFSSGKFIANTTCFSFCLICKQEKHMGLTPMEMMDRERAVIPKLQIDFLDAIALPVYRWCSVSRWLLEMSFGFALYMEYRKPVKKTPFPSASWHFRRTHCLK